MLSLIEQDHKKVEQLLNVLTKQLAQLQSQQHSINYVLMGDIVNYLRNYIDRYHHPKEDLIYAYYLEYYVADAQMSNRLAFEHQRLNFISRQLAHSLSLIQLDSVTPVDEFSERLQEFISEQRAHIQFENSMVLPLIVKTFSPDDWCHIEHLWKHGDLQDANAYVLFSEVYNTLVERIEAAGLATNGVNRVA